MGKCARAENDAVSVAAALLAPRRRAHRRAGANGKPRMVAPPVGGPRGSTSVPGVLRGAGVLLRGIGATALPAAGEAHKKFLGKSWAPGTNPSCMVLCTLIRPREEVSGIRRIRKTPSRPCLRSARRARGGEPPRAPRGPRSSGRRTSRLGVPGHRLGEPGARRILESGRGAPLGGGVAASTWGGSCP